MLYHVKEMLKVVILRKKLFILNELNNRIQSFDFGYHNDTNKPSQILQRKLLSVDNGRRQHGKICLVCYLYSVLTFVSHFQFSVCFVLFLQKIRCGVWLCIYQCSLVYVSQKMMSTGHYIACCWRLYE